MATLEECTMQIYAISRWQEVFEKSDARKAKSLTWISCPVSFNSTGYQSLLEEFDGVTAAALYGAWLALCQVAATSPIRGQLSGQKGEPYSAGRIARLSGLPSELFEKLLPWAIKVGWLVGVNSIGCDAVSDRIDDAVSASSGESPDGIRTTSGESPDDFREIPTTGQDRTRQDRTGQDGTGQDNTRSPARPGPNSGELQNANASLSSEVAAMVAENAELQALQLVRVAPDPAEAAEMLTSVFMPLKASDVLSKKPMWWAAVWYKRQLAAPDPVLRGSNAAEAAIVVALAISLAKVPEVQVKKSRTSMFISLLTKGSSGLRSRASPHLAQAVQLVSESLARQSAVAT
jgi:hypothetical protein